MNRHTCFAIAVWAGTAITGSAQTTPIPVSSPPGAASTSEPDYPVARVGVLSYLQYDAELKNRDGFNNFDVTRAYLNVNAQVASNLRFRFTPDIRRVNDGSLAGSLVVRVKYAYAQFGDITPLGWIRLGAHQTPWLDFEESINRYRVQGQMFAEREGLIPGSSDFGVSYFASLPGRYGEVHAGVFNGEGFGQPESNKYKSVQARLTLRPLPTVALARGLRISGFFNAGWYAADRPRRLGILMTSFEHPQLVVTIERIRATENSTTTVMPDVERSGWSAFVEPRQGASGLAGILRYDAFDPDASLADDARNRIIGGGAYWFAWPRARLGLVISGEDVRYDSRARPEETRVLVQTHVEF